MKELDWSIKTLESLQSNMEVSGTTAASILQDVGDFVRHDLPLLIGNLKQAKMGLENKTTLVAPGAESQTL